MLSRKELHKRWQHYISQIKSEEEFQSYENFVADYLEECYQRQKGEN